MSETKNIPGGKPDVSFQVMPKSGKISYISNTPPPPPSAQSPVPIPSPSPINEPTGGGSKIAYTTIGIIVVVILGGLAYYFLGVKNSNTEVTSKIPKTWMSQRFGVETCMDQVTCGDDADPDNDGLNNYREFAGGTDPKVSDSDSDGLADGDEVNIYNTDPSKKYTDTRAIAAQNDYNDGASIKNGYDPLTPGLKFTDTRLQQIQSKIQSQGLHEPTKTTLGLNAPTGNTSTNPASGNTNTGTTTGRPDGTQ